MNMDNGVEMKELVVKVSDIVGRISGNRLESKQYFMVETRLKKRMIDLGISTPADYTSYLNSNIHSETGRLISLLTTHHTFFFREFSHFEFLREKLPELIDVARKRGDKTIRVWSAACSRGQEVYSVAMFLQYHLGQIAGDISFKILGTDIDQESVDYSINGVYHWKQIKEIPRIYIEGNWMRGTGDISEFVKVKNELRSKCQFKRANLLTISNDIGNEKFDVIFCRNVFIYFEENQIRKIVQEQMKHLFERGFLFTGISESLMGLNMEVLTLAPSVYADKSYQKNVVKKDAIPSSQSTSSRTGVAVQEMIMPLKVVCVDDSPIIHKLLDRILVKEKGFVIVGHAYNGIEAHSIIEKMKPDLVTLDIHMPEMNGIEYLKKHYSQGHPPVVVLSSVSRDDSELAFEALSRGASDFVEKPSMNNLSVHGEEIIAKLKVANSLRTKKTCITKTDKAFAQKFSILEPSKKMNLLYANISMRADIKEYLSQVNSNFPPVVVFFEGNDELLPGLAKEFSTLLKKDVYVMDNDLTVSSGNVYLTDFSKNFDKIKESYKDRQTTFGVISPVSKRIENKITSWNDLYILVNDSIEENKHLNSFATDVVPVTSFVYLISSYFATLK